MLILTFLLAACRAPAPAGPTATAPSSPTDTASTQATGASGPTGTAPTAGTSFTGVTGVTGRTGSSGATSITGLTGLASTGSTSGTGSSASTGATGLLRDTAATAVTGDTSLITGDTAGVIEVPWCESMPPGPITTLPIPQQTCNYEPALTTSPGVTLSGAAVAMARIDGADGKVMGFSLAVMDDADGDGFGELAIGGFGHSDWYGMYQTAGEVWVFDGDQLTGVLGRNDALSRRGGFVHPTIGPQSGDAVRMVTGDVMHTGGQQLIVSGRDTYVLELPLAPGDGLLQDMADATLLHSQAMARFGHVAIADIDGDGSDDLVTSGFGAPSCFEAGGVAAFLGPLSGEQTQTGQLAWSVYDPTDLRADLNIRPCAGYMSMGGLWDLNGDGTDEVYLVGSRFDNVAPVSDPLDLHGGFAVFAGGVEGLQEATDAMVVVRGDCGSGVGHDATVLGDVTGDGERDLAVGASHFAFDDGVRRGAVFIISELHRASGTVPLSAVSCAMVYGEESGDAVWSSASLGDLNGDGHDDFAVAGTDAFSDSGAAYIFFGPVQGVMSTASAAVTLVGEGGGFGYEMTSGDLDGDGVPDLVVGAHASNIVGNSDSDGRAYVFSGALLAGYAP